MTRLPLPKKTLLAAARRYGTPLYVYSAAVVRSRLRELSSAFSSVPHLVCYALKANSNASLCRLIEREGTGADVVSGGELWQALRSGFHPRRIVFSGVGKTESEIAMALKSGILLLNAESEEELDAMERVARRLKKKLPLSIRVNPGIAVRTHAHLATGKGDSKFGVSPDSAARLYLKAAKSGFFEVLGIQAHLGSQIASPEPYRKALKFLLQMAHDLRPHGIRLRYVDIGGGWAVPEAGQAPLPIAELAKVAVPLAKGSPYTLILEPGRFLVAEAGILLTRVLYRKESRGRSFIIVDAAMNDFLRPSLYGARPPVLPLGKDSGEYLRADVVGPVCEAGDFLARNAVLDRPERGEVLAVLNAGAYGFSMSSQYNFRPRAAEALIDGRLRLIRRRETYQDIARNEIA